LELRTTRIAAERLRESAPKAEFVGHLKFYVRELQSRLHDEIETVFFLQLSAAERDFYQSADPFGPDVSLKFPYVVYETAEAYRCLSLNRSTASAFHSIRCLEVSIRAISRCLGIPDPTKAADRWGKLLGVIKNEIDRRWTTSSARMSGDGPPRRRRDPSQAEQP
jgi:hypothetical protein